MTPVSLTIYHYAGGSIISNNTSMEIYLPTPLYLPAYLTLPIITSLGNL